MQYLVPQFILEQYTRGRFHGRFRAAALMLDISGFTATTNTFMQHGVAGAEAMADVMQSIFDPLVEAVYAHGGFIAGFAGDAFIAIFPELTTDLPLASQAPRQALAAAAAMQQQMLAHPTGLRHMARLISSSNSAWGKEQLNGAL